jgi:hypothetical protein
MTYVSCFYHAFSGAQKVSWGWGGSLAAVAADVPSLSSSRHCHLSTCAWNVESEVSPGANFP